MISDDSAPTEQAVAASNIPFSDIMYRHIENGRYAVSGNRVSAVVCRPDRNNAAETQTEQRIVPAYEMKETAREKRGFIRVVQTNTYRAKIIASFKTLCK